MRRVCYVSGSRADFGHMAATLQRAQASGKLDVAVCVTGMHLAPAFGATVKDVEASGLRICGRVPVRLESSTGAAMAKGIAEELAGITDVLERARPDLTLLLGDRGEMLAGALASIHLGIPVVHVHGGERSGTVDEPVRHAISKLAHYHFVATAESRERLIRMGELASHVFVTGAPGLDGLERSATLSRKDLCKAAGLDPARPVALVVFHPVLQQSAEAGEQMAEIVRAIVGCGLQALCLTPNADAGRDSVAKVLRAHAARRGIRVVTHLPRSEFVSWMAAADVMVGNSSAGIIEAATFGLPVVNVGTRQNARERSANTTDTPAEERAISAAIRSALSSGRANTPNVYGGPGASERIVDLLSTLPLTPALMEKVNSY